MPDALVGSTGFVGGTLLRYAQFDDRFHSTDIESIRGRRYDLLVCAGAPAEKWKANREPDRDRANIGRLMDCLGDVTARHVVLISTVDVYHDPIAVDEDAPVEPAHASAYGRHRFELEQFVRERFASTVVRLPALFGQGLKKNVVFDMLTDNGVAALCLESEFQFYDLLRLWGDIETARRHELPLVNLSVEPTSVRDVAQVGLGLALDNAPCASAVRYDMRTKHAAFFGATGAYLEGRDEVLTRLRTFAETWRRDHA